MQQVRAHSFAAFVSDHDLCLIAFVRRGDGPSTALLKNLGALQGVVRGDVDVGVIDVDRDAAIAADFRVTALPTVGLIRHRELVFLEPGALSVEALDALVTASSSPG